MGRIVFLTGHASNHPLVVEAQRIGDAEIFSKPIDPDRLRSIVEGEAPVTLSRDLAVRHAWRGAFVAAALNAVGMSADFLLARDIPTMPIYPFAMSVLVGIGLIVFLLIRRQQATVRLGSAVFLVNTVAILVALWITSGYWATTGRTWTPFQANKLGALAVAMLAPQLGVGLASIAGFAATAIGKFYVPRSGNSARIPRGRTVVHPDLRAVRRACSSSTVSAAWHSSGKCCACRPRLRPPSNWRGPSCACATTPTRPSRPLPSRPSCYGRKITT